MSEMVIPKGIDPNQSYYWTQYPEDGKPCYSIEPVNRCYFHGTFEEHYKEFIQPRNDLIEYNRKTFIHRHY